MRRILSRTLKKAKQVKLPRGKTAKFFLLLGAVFFSFTFFGGNFGFVRIWNLHKKQHELELESKKLQIEILDLQVEKEKLLKDKTYLEKMAREKLGMAKEGEKVYQFVPPEDSDSSEKTQLPK